ncbi:MAG TPA: hypothetical protein VM689_20960 [Aliidongia sp.]|nr:hypothetical protein [Aliidongia sp.]
MKLLKAAIILVVLSAMLVIAVLAALGPIPEPAGVSASVALPPVAPAECLQPGPAPTLPNGGIADLADMQLQRRALQAFIDALADYRHCLRQKRETMLDADPTQQLDWLNQADHASRDADALRAAFERQNRIFSERTRSQGAVPNLAGGRGVRD